MVAGALSALGFAPLGFWPLTLLGLAFTLELIATAGTLRSAFARGWAFGVGHFSVGLNWIATAFTYQSNMPAWLGWVAVVLLSLYLACFPALSGAVAWRLSRHTRIGFACVFAAAWMLFEWLRATLVTGFAWNPLAVTWLDFLWIAQSAKWLGTYGLSGLIALSAGLLWAALRVRRWPLALAVLVGLTIIGLALRLSAGEPAATGIPVRIVQPNIAQNEKNDPEQRERNEQLYTRLSGKPSAAPRLLLWPEGSTERFLELEPEARAALVPLLGPHDLLLLSGESVEPGEEAALDIYHNSVFELDATGALRWRYDKAHLVPFGEYLPARSVLGRIGLSRLLPGDGDFTPGPGPRTFPLRGFGPEGSPATVGVQLCYEIVFSGHVVDEAHRPSFVFNPSDDAWFGAWGPPQHLAQAQLRAIEEGLPIIRATPNGISAVIGPTGRLLQTIGRHRAGAIDTTIPQRLPPTLFSRLGLWTCVLFGAVLGALGLGLSRRRL